MEEGKLEKIIKPIFGIALICYLTYIGLGILFKSGETVVNRMEDRAAAIKKKAEESRKVAIQKMEIRKIEVDQKKAEAERIKAEEELAIAKAKKENSNECQFWKLQKKQGTSSKADQKIAEHCNI